jgi:hypothetical protein
VDSETSQESGSGALEQGQPSANDIETIRELWRDVSGLLNEFSKKLARWPAIFIVGVGLALLVTDFLIEVVDERMTSTEYVATLIVAAALCLVGGSLVVALSRQLRQVTQAGVETFGGQVSEAKMAELRRVIGLTTAKDNRQSD